MANQTETTITVTDAPDDDERAVIADGLRAYNEAQAGYSDSRALALLVSDPETKKVVGGLLGDARPSRRQGDLRQLGLRRRCRHRSGRRRL